VIEDYPGDEFSAKKGLIFALIPDLQSLVSKHTINMQYFIFFFFFLVNRLFSQTNYFYSYFCLKDVVPKGLQLVCTL